MIRIKIFFHFNSLIIYYKCSVHLLLAQLAGLTAEMHMRRVSGKDLFHYKNKIL